MSAENFCGLSELHANIVLHTWLLTPLTPEQQEALAASTHFADAASEPVVIEARKMVLANAALPWDFTRSLDSCRRVEERLSNSQMARYCIQVERLIGATHFIDDLLLLCPSQRVRALLPALGLIKKNEGED